MKIRLGRRDISPSRLEDELSDSVLKAIQKQSIVLSRPRIERLARQIEAAAQGEADLMIETILALIDRDLSTSDRSVQAITYQDLMRGAITPSGFTPPGGLGEGFAIHWIGLSREYLMRKTREYVYGVRGRGLQRFPPERFFEYSGRLRAYFATYGWSFVHKRLGGVKVEATIADDFAAGSHLKSAGYRDEATDIRRESYRNVLLGSIKVKVFPNIASSLLPMLSSNSWMSMLETNGEFERQLLADAGGDALQVAKKLINRDRPYRPLLLPVVQFWMQVRIPSAIFAVVKEFSKTAHLKREPA